MLGEYFFYFEIICMITDQIAVCSVQLPQLILFKWLFTNQSFRATLVKLKEMFS